MKISSFFVLSAIAVTLAVPIAEQPLGDSMAEEHLLPLDLIEQASTVTSSVPGILFVSFVLTASMISFDAASLHRHYQWRRHQCKL